MNTKPRSQVARVHRPHRSQVEMQFFSLDQMLPSDHRARVVWKFVEGLDLEPLYARVQVSHSKPGRPAIAPEILVSLWLLATLDGISSARELARRCETDIAYLWILGGVTVNHHSLSDFRVDHGDFLESLLIDTVASLVHGGLVPLETIAQDGMRVRANAGSSSFRRKPSLEQLQKEAALHLQRLQQETESDSDRRAGDARRQAAAKRAARERQARIDEALSQQKELSQQREKRKKGDGQSTRMSVTDPDARNMKMANGGFNPAYNVQFVTDADTRIIVGVAVTNSGNDGGLMGPMHQQICNTYEKVPRQELVDSAYATQACVERVESAGTEVISTIPKSNTLIRNGKDPHARQRDDTDNYANFRNRMSKDEYKDLYRQRPSVAELPNADCRNRNLRQFRVRGLPKVRCVALWHALAFNFCRMFRLGFIGT